MIIYRQGDVLIRSVKDIPADTTPIPRENGSIVLAHGEVTGHAHAIASEFATFVAAGGLRYLDAKIPVSLRHEEHGEIQIPAGKYEIVIQREYTPQEIRNVED